MTFRPEELDLRKLVSGLEARGAHVDVAVFYRW